jgi:hypothetical protein
MTVRGLANDQIAAVAGVDEATVREDQQASAEDVLGKEPLAAERARLLAAARQVEQAAWQIFRDLPPHVVEARLAALGTVLSAHGRTIEIVGAIERQSMVQDLAALGEQFLTQVRDGKIVLGLGYDSSRTAAQVSAEPER